jgi:hypothetical protein
MSEEEIVVNVDQNDEANVVDNEDNVLNTLEAVLAYFNEAVDKAVPVQKDINDIKKDTLRDIGICIKEGFKRPPAEFTATCKLLHDLNALSGDIEDSKLLKTFDKFKSLVEQLKFLGHGDLVERLGKKVGLETNLLFDVQDTLGKADIEDYKFNDCYVNLFSDDVPEDTQLIFENLLNAYNMAQQKVDNLTSFIKNDLGDAVKVNTRVAKTTFTKAVKLKIKSEVDTEVEDDIHNITEVNLLENSVFEHLLYNEDDDIEEIQ